MGVGRPTRVSTLHPLLQRALEATPHPVPRVDTAPPGRCTGSDRGFPGAVLWLSESGCRFRSAERRNEGGSLRLLFALPHRRMISPHVRVIEPRGEAVGLRFDDATARSRFAIARYVEDRLIAP
ncbi:MAG: PilZ domain-containing protein [Myxococcales bacterium]|nr:PilZ domain-containing protein [Myxococcales bacterium]